LRRPRFSVVIPCFNEAAYIGETLESLKNQNFAGEFEVIVVDNNCRDETAAIAMANGAKIVEEKRPGVCWARQAGTAVANGEIVVSTDADTVFASDWLDRINKSFQRCDSAVAVAGPCRYNNAPWWGKIFPKFLFGAVALMYKLTGRPFYITATNVAFKKSAWESYNTTLTQGGDELDLLHKLRDRGKVVFKNSNPTLTSARRLNRGLFYNVFVSFLVYYLLAYNLNKIFKRTILGTAPAYRESKGFKGSFMNYYKFAFVSICLLAILWDPLRINIGQYAYGALDAVGDVIKYLV